MTIGQGYTNSFVIATVARPKRLVGCVSSLLDQAVLPDEIVIVDAHPPKQAIDLQRQIERMLNPKPIALKYIISKHAHVCYQRNLGTKAAGSDIIHIIDDDVILDPGYLEAIMAVYERSQANEVIGVQGTVINPWSVSRWYQILAWLFLLSYPTEGAKGGRQRVSGFVIHCTRPSTVTPVQFFMHTCASYRRDVFDHIEMDESLHPYGLHHDLDFSLQAGKLGALYQTPYARVTHKKDPAGRPSSGKFNELHLVTSYYCFRKHMPSTLFHRICHMWAQCGLALLAMVPLIRYGWTEPLSGIMKGFYRILRNDVP